MRARARRLAILALLLGVFTLTVIAMAVLTVVGLLAILGGNT